MKAPALTAWRQELAAGKRNRFTFDPLWRAACEEAHALEAPTPGLTASAMAAARRIIRSAQKGRAA